MPKSSSGFTTLRLKSQFLATNDEALRDRTRVHLSDLVFLHFSSSPMGLQHSLLSVLLPCQDICTGYVLCHQISAGLASFCHWGISSQGCSLERPFLNFHLWEIPNPHLSPSPPDLASQNQLYLCWFTVIYHLPSKLQLCEGRDSSPSCLLFSHQHFKTVPSTEWSPVNVYSWNNRVVSFTLLKNAALEVKHSFVTFNDVPQAVSLEVVLNSKVNTLHLHE